jgi:hypothetical protein
MSASARLPAVLLFGVAAAAVVLPRAACGQWNDVETVAFGTAQVLDKGQTTFGVFSPLAYGVSDRLTIQSHPVLDLLLFLNAEVRYLVHADAAWIVCAEASYRHALNRSAARSDGGVAGALAGGGRATRLFGGQLALTAGLAWTPDILATAAGSELDQGAAAAFALHWLQNQRQLWLLSARQRASVETRALARPEVTVAVVRWVPDWRAHLILGISSGAARGGPVDWPVTPVVDLWWRL